MRFWYSDSFKATLFAALLFPFSLLFGGVAAMRRALFAHNILPTYRAAKPVIIVGNLSVGGNGKTPVVIWLVEQLRQRGINAGVISRGYGSRSAVYPLWVNADTNPIEGGDEPVLIATRTGVPVCISPDRRQAVERLLSQQDCDVIIADDGLQHYRLERDLEIVVVDAARRFGNGLLLPAGPLRERPSRLKSVDLVIANGGDLPFAQAVMRLKSGEAVNLHSGERCPLADFAQATAIAGIGNPARFFDMLQRQGIALTATQAFSDHQAFTPDLLATLPSNLPLLMTEKDAVKCRAFARPNWWAVPVDVDIQGGDELAAFWHKLEKRIAQQSVL